MKNPWKGRKDYQFFFLGNSLYAKDKKKLLSPMYNAEFDTWSGYYDTSINGFVNDAIMLMHSQDTKTMLHDIPFCISAFKRICGRNMDLTSILKGMNTKETLGSMAYYDLYNKWYKILYTIGYCAMFFRNKIFMDFLAKKKNLFLFYAHPNDRKLGINCSSSYAVNTLNGPHRFTGNNFIGCMLMSIRDAYLMRKERKEGQEERLFKITVSCKKGFMLVDYFASLLCLYGYSEWSSTVSYVCDEDAMTISCLLPNTSNISNILSDITEELSLYPDSEIVAILRKVLL